MVRRGGNLSEKLVKKKMKIGLDVGSTTLKCVVYSEEGEPVFQEYERHYSQIAEKASGMLLRIQEKFPELKKASLCVSGSAGMGLAEDLDIPFVQEVYATRTATRKYLPQADVVIELGGEDAKILFLTGSMEVRMNGSCAGGTGAFIDQMATLLSITPTELNEIAGESERTYSIASRCGVFAKSDIQALLNQGAQKNDIAASILVAVVNQTIAGLAQGREITGNVVYLGGPLTFFSRLREAFDRILGVKGICPENSLYYVAAGAALSEAGEEFDLEEITDKIKHYSSSHHYQASSALFRNQAEYEEFVERHQRDKVEHRRPPAGGQEGLCGHRRGLYHGEGGGGKRGRGHHLLPLPAQLRQPGAPGAGVLAGAVPEVPGYSNLLRGLYGLRGGDHQERLWPGHGSGGDHRPLYRRQEVRAGGGLHHRHRRPGHQVLPDQERGLLTISF